MTQEDNACCGPRPHSLFMPVKLLLFAAVILGCTYFITTNYKAPSVNITSLPNVYVSSTPPDHTIGTSATATVYVASDLLIIQLGATTEAKTANKSQEDNAIIMNLIKKDIEALGIPKDKIKTAYYSVDVIRTSSKICKNYTLGSDCSYEYPITGYKTTHKLSISLDDLSLGGKVLDTSSAAGANEVDGITFTLKEKTRNAIQMQLLQNASADAKAHAQEMATGLGVTLGKPLSASESLSYYPMTKSYESSYYPMAASSTAASTSLSSGQIEVSASVSASFAIS